VVAEVEADVVTVLVIYLVVAVVDTDVDAVDETVVVMVV
jgi:hypothetical protein